MILNQIALNPIVHYQQFAYHVQQQLPTLMIPVHQLDAASASRAVEEEPLDHEKSSEYIQLHTRVDYQPWLQQLYREWQRTLAQTFDAFAIKQSPPEPEHWQPENTARLINTLGLNYAGCLIHKFKHNPIEAIDKITLTWNVTWQDFRYALTQEHTQTATLQVLDHTAEFFTQFWLESWLHIADLQATLPENPAEKNS